MELVRKKYVSEKTLLITHISFIKLDAPQALMELFNDGGSPMTLEDFREWLSELN